jgi:predicted CXXCH cytochrome family protein
MTPRKTIKFSVTVLSVLAIVLWASASTFSRADSSGRDDAKTATVPQGSEYAGSEACKDCHEDLFNNYEHTKHAKLTTLASWKGKATGCEGCHGPAKAHVDGGGDVSKIISLKSKSSKEISETCLTCHAGKEEHNNFRRGEHWRNDVGCTDCHAVHSPVAKGGNPGSNTLVSEAERRNQDTLLAGLLKNSQPQLCLQCHAEMKAQFNMPFHHRVLEGEIKCSDCHNPHGGFELKQTRLSVGSDNACLKCHTDKQGPFVFEHAPLKTEGCTICHTPHGSANPKLLMRAQVRQLCFECHSNAGEVAGPNTPSFHNQATVRFQNCTTCHARIHGSQVDQFFFR